ncbi:hypothetical protein NL529_31715, partial [Klebsiella pneumoniae]|nr:hypothetical protein [Klebsiella pneumoniae]
QATSFAAHAVHGLATVTQADEASCYKGGCSQGVQGARPGFPGTTFFSFEYVHGRSRPLMVGDVLELSWVPDAPDDLQPYPPPT